MTDKSIYFHVQTRNNIGKSAKKLKRNGIIPANLYGLNDPSVSIQISTAELHRLTTGGHDAGLVYLNIEGQTKPVPVLLDEIARHSVSQQVQHLVFRRVDLKQEVEKEVQIEVVGVCEVVDATPVLVKDTVNIKAIPENIPEFVQVSVTELTEVGQSITLSKLILPSGVTLVMSEDETDEPIVVLQTTKVIEPVEVEEVVEATDSADSADSGESTKVDDAKTESVEKSDEKSTQDKPAK